MQLFTAIHLLCVEDDRDDFLLLYAALSAIEDTSFNTTWVSSYDDACIALANSRYDLCMVDYRLGVHNGIEFIRQAGERAITTPMILLTGMNDRSVDAAALRAGAADYLLKAEINTSILERAIRHTLERAMTLRALQRHALYDTLTGLPNRTLFTERLRLLVERAQQNDSQFAVLFLDLDRFRVISNSLGHRAGDQLLIAIGQRLLGCAGDNDIVARLGGDEFALLLSSIAEASDAYRVADRIQEALAAPFKLRNHDIFTSASIGIALSVISHEDPGAIMRDADIAMYRAKTGGRGRYEVFDAAMHAHAVEQLQIETDLRRAVERDEFVVHYQPIVELSSGQVHGFEALVRWLHPTLGLLAPGQFLPMAEESGLITTIDWCVLCEACRQLAVWDKQFPELPPLTMSVNLSSSHFGHPELIDRIQEELAKVGLSGKRLRLEIIETAIMDHADIAAGVLTRLREQGVQVSIDDFGTGYSSLSYLHRFPVDTLKIDRSFVWQATSGKANTSIIRSIISLARDLGMQVVAEGVETRAQLDYLRALRCEYVQGYLVSRPLDEQAAAQLLFAQGPHVKQLCLAAAN